MEKGRVLATPGSSAETVSFPIRSLISTVTETLEGAAVEVALAGHEGFSPVVAAFGGLISPHLTLMQIPGSDYCMSATVFIDALNGDAELRRRALLYAQYSFAAATQFAACNRLHSVQERYARWILMADDRIGTGEFSLTQEYSAQMLGVRRTSVTAVAQELSVQGLISYRRGIMSIKDRPGLEELTCECYAAVNAELLRLMGYGARQPVLRQFKGP